MAGHHTNGIQDEMLPAIPHHYDASELMKGWTLMNAGKNLKTEGRCSYATSLNVSNSLSSNSKSY